MTKTIFLSAAAMAASALWLTPVLAEPLTPSAYVSGGYSYLDTSGGGGHLNDGNVNAAALLPLGALNIQVNGAYDGLSGSGASGHIDNVSGSVFYGNTMGRIGATVGYGDIGAGSGVLGISGGTTDTTFGGFGELYGRDTLTVGVKGGDIHVSGTDVAFVGGEVTGYVLPDLALRGSIDYAKVNDVHATSYGVRGEYLISERVPISVFAAYNYADVGGLSGHANIFSVGLTIYLGSGHGSLLQHQRSGPDVWGADQSLARLLF